jgi:hypothetical protein
LEGRRGKGGGSQHTLIATDDVQVGGPSVISSHASSCSLVFSVSERSCCLHLLMTCSSSIPMKSTASSESRSSFSSDTRPAPASYRIMSMYVYQTCIFNGREVTCRKQPRNPRHGQPGSKSTQHLSDWEPTSLRASRPQSENLLAGAGRAMFLQGIRAGQRQSVQHQWRDTRGMTKPPRDQANKFTSLSLTGPPLVYERPRGQSFRLSEEARFRLSLVESPVGNCIPLLHAGSRRSGKEGIARTRGRGGLQGQGEEFRGREAKMAACGGSDEGWESNGTSGDFLGERGKEDADQVRGSRSISRARVCF